ncbi:MAG: 4-(cytidine 5'-diphospho)-2-C-methyl-D-erythritol kinase [Caldisericum exile]|uniref:4-(cytidine 5'-diphospho)-2-C-methyl-D-erythritol kinase n=1 Tax=Caldisericum TaxID=693074 RepID=UPI0039FD0BD0
MKAKAYAKINLTLEIVGEAGEYHAIESVFQKIGLFDVVSVKLGKTDSVIFSQSIRNVTSTVHKALELFKERAKVKENFEIYIEKNIPMGSGLGGGSADGAVTLLLLNAMFKNIFSKNDLHQIAKEVGSDVPFFLYSNTALVKGVGDIVQELPSLKEFYFVLVHPKFHFKTKEMYSMFHEYGKYSDGSRTLAMVELIEKGNYSAKDIDKLCYNDFEMMLLEKSEKFVEFKKVLETVAEVRFHLTGSGSTLFAIFDTKKDAEKVKNTLDKFKFDSDIASSLV